MSQVGKIVELLDTNKINYARNFVNIERNGYDSDECQKLSYEIREDIEEILHLGFDNGGFTTDMKNAIFELTEIAVKLSAYKAVDKLNSYIKDKNKITDKFKNYQGEKNMPDIKKEVNLYIDDSLKGLESLILEEKSDYNKNILNASKDLLLELKEKVNGVYDNVSKKAADYAAELLGGSDYGLFAWRDYMGRRMIFDTVNEHLKEAINEAEKWAALTKAANKRELAKENDIVKYEADVFSQFAGMNSVKEKGDAFFARLKNFDEECNSQNEIFDKVNELSNEIEAKKRKIADIIDKIDRGEIFEEDGDDQITNIEEEIKIKEENINQYRSSIRMMNKNILALRKLILKFNRLQLIYDMYQRIEPNLFYAMFEDIDFRVFLDVLNYGADEDSITQALQYFDNVMRDVKSQTRHAAQTDRRFNKIIQLIDSDTIDFEESASNKVDLEKEAAERKKRMEERRKRYAKPASDSSNENTSNKTDENKSAKDSAQINDII